MSTHGVQSKGQILLTSPALGCDEWVGSELAKAILRLRSSETSNSEIKQCVTDFGFLMEVLLPSQKNQLASSQQCGQGGDRSEPVDKPRKWPGEGPATLQAPASTTSQEGRPGAHQQQPG